MIRGTRRPSGRGARRGGRGSRGPKGGTGRDTAPGCMLLVGLGMVLFSLSGFGGILLAEALLRAAR